MPSLLIVDDDARMRTLIWNIVSDLFDSVRECGDGAAARSMYGEQHPDWVFMDITMPCLNGIEATREIRSNDPAAKIVIVTAYKNDVLRDAALNAGARAYVLKENLFELRDILSVPPIRLATPDI